MDARDFLPTAKPGMFRFGARATPESIAKGLRLLADEIERSDIDVVAIKSGTDVEQTGFARSHLTIEYFVREPGGKE